MYTYLCQILLLPNCKELFGPVTIIYDVEEKVSIDVFLTMDFFTQMNINVHALIKNLKFFEWSVTIFYLSSNSRYVECKHYGFIIRYFFICHRYFSLQQLIVSCLLWIFISIKFSCIYFTFFINCKITEIFNDAVSFRMLLVH